jgi:FkbM family methyltransferase
MTLRISYAQNFEDLMLWRALSGVAEGRYIDIGAQSPVIDSVSRLFHQAGWRGVHVEPSTAYAAELREQRPGDLVIESVVAQTPGEHVFFEIPETGLSTIRDDIASAHADAGFAPRERRVEAITLDDVFALAGEGAVHWLKIDVEGAEADVLAGWRTSPQRPWIVLVESTRPLTQIESHDEWESLLTAKGYRFAWFDGLNRFYVAPEHAALLAAFAAPPNVFDGFELCNFSAREDAVYTTSEQWRGTLAQAQAQFDLERAQVDAQRAAERADFDTQRADFDAQRADLTQQRDAGIAARMALEAAHAVEMHALQASHADALHAAQLALSNALAEGQRFHNQARAAQTERNLARVEAHRWWLAHEAVMAERDLMLASHSWRLTAPLRLARRVLANPKQALRSVARRTVLATMRLIVASPLRVPAQRVLARMPGMRQRMRGLAVHAQIIPGDHATLAFAAPASTPVGARRIHARLLRAMQGHTH